MWSLSVRQRGTSPPFRLRAVDAPPENLCHLPPTVTPILAAVQTLYAMTDRDSYRGIPFILSTYNSAEIKDHYQKAHRRIMEDPPDWILFQWLPLPYAYDLSPSNHIVTYLHLEDELKSSYELVWKTGPLAIAKRKTPMHND